MFMKAVVLAGGLLSPEDPLYHQTIDGSRCMIEVVNKPMLQWVIDALDQSQAIQEIFVIGLQPQADLTASKPLHFLEDQGNLFDNIQYGVLQATNDHPSQSRVVLASGDVPAIKPHMVDWLAEQSKQDLSMMLFYNVITKEVMESRYPNANRSFVKFMDIAVCGGDINIVDKSLFDTERPIWKKLADARKKPLKQVSYLGFGNLLLVALRLVTLEVAVKRVCKKLGIRGKALICPYAEMAMDADKPHQLEILRSDLDVPS